MFNTFRSMAGPDFDTMNFGLLEKDIADCRREFDANGLEGCK